MKFVWLAIFISGCFALPKEKQLSILSVVSFPNEECQAVSDKTSKGTCVTSTECGEFGGTVDGNCASGFGVCCKIFAKGCDSNLAVTKNRTYVINPNYPSAFTTTSKTCKYTIYPDGDGICQLRLDFDTLTLSNPGTNGACTGTVDQIAFSSATGGLKIGNICGENSGLHVYLEAGNKNPAGSFTITTRTASYSRKWKIKVSQIPCEATYRAPQDCVQYFTGTTGRFQSFNHPSYIPQAHQYSVCIRQEAGHCSIGYTTYQQGSNEDFRLTPASATTTITNSKRTRSCDNSQIQIRLDATVADIYCGRSFSSIANQQVDGVVFSNVLPFMVLVTSWEEDQIGATGFSLQYQQHPCGERLGETL